MGFQKSWVFSASPVLKNPLAIEIMTRIVKPFDIHPFILDPHELSCLLLIANFYL